MNDAIGRRTTTVLLFLAALVVTSCFTLSYAGPARADSVGSLKAQAKAIYQKLIQEQLEASAYQQQYSVATERVDGDERAIASTQQQITGDMHSIATRVRAVRKLALKFYVLNGSVSATSGAGLFDEDVRTLLSANEYATISLGSMNEAVAQLHTAQQAEEADQAVLVQRKAADQAEQSAQAGYLQQANATTSQYQSAQATVTGQLAVAVDQQNAAEAAAAAAAVAAAQQKASPQRATAYVSSNTTDPALNPFLQCVRQAESGGNYQAVSPNGMYMGAFQFSQPTWNYAAQAAGRPDLVGVPPNEASKADQDSMAVALYSLDGERPWLGDRCSTA